jgi:DNA gyrase subunit A
MNIKELLECYVAHRREVVTRRTQFRLRKAKDRAEILEGYKIALDNLDDFVRIIRASANKEEAKVRLMEKYPLNERQTDAILELRLYQLTGLERGKIEAEYLELLKAIEYYESILASEHLLLELIKTELLEMKAKYTQPRRSEIIAAEGEFRMEDVIANEGCVITVSHLGFIKRTRVADYRVQKRGGKGIIGTETYEEDFVEHLFTASTHDYILFVTSTGKSYAKKVYDVPEGARTTKGKSVTSFLKLVEGEKIAAMVCFSAFTDDRFLVLATQGGIVKKTMLSEYEGATREREGGLAAINLREDDRIVGGVLTSGTNEIVLVSHQGLAVRFQEGPIDSAAAEDDSAAEVSATAAPVEGEAEVGEVRVGLRATGRATGGVTGMRFKRKGDFVQAIEVCDSSARLLVAREDGIGKRTPFEDYRLTRRGGSGVIAIDLPEDGKINVAGALSVHDTDEIMLLTAKNQSVRCPVAGIRETGRGAKGVKLIDLAEGDKLLSVARIVDTREDDEAPVEAPPSA